MPKRSARIASSSGVVKSTPVFSFLLRASEGVEDAEVACGDGDVGMYGEEMDTEGVSAPSSSMCARATDASIRACVFQNIAISVAQNHPR